MRWPTSHRLRATVADRSGVHWTGTRWISTVPHGPTQAFELAFAAPILGSARAWAVGFNNSRPGSSAYRGLIAPYGSRP